MRKKSILTLPQSLILVAMIFMLPSCGANENEKFANKSNPDIDGTYSLTYKSEELPPERSLLLRLESGKAYTRLKGDPNQTEEVGDYRVVGNKITDASGRTEIFTLEDDGSMTIPNIPKDFRFIK